MAPCAFYCRALCGVRRTPDVHSANVLASRQRRVSMGMAAPAGGAFAVRPGGVNSSWPIRDCWRRRYHDDVCGGE